MAAQSFSHSPGFSGRGGKSNLRSSSARSFRRFGPRLVSAMALEPKNANCWKPVIQLLLFLGYVKVSFKFPGHLLSNYVKLCQTMSNQLLRSCHSCWAWVFFVAGEWIWMAPKKCRAQPDLRFAEEKCPLCSSKYERAVACQKECGFTNITTSKALQVILRCPWQSPCWMT